MAVLGESVSKKQLRSRQERGATEPLSALSQAIADNQSNVDGAAYDAGFYMATAVGLFGLACLCPPMAGVAQLGWVPSVYGGMALAASGESAHEHFTHKRDLPKLLAQKAAIHKNWQRHTTG